MALYMTVIGTNGTNITITDKEITACVTRLRDSKIKFLVADISKMSYGAKFNLLVYLTGMTNESLFLIDKEQFAEIVLTLENSS